MARKTIQVEAVRKRAVSLLNLPNSPVQLDDPVFNTPDLQAIVDRAFRLGVTAVLEHVLHATGNYHGFRYTVEPYEADPTRRDYY